MPSEQHPEKYARCVVHQLALRNSVAFCSPAKSLTFGGLMENALVGKKLKS